METAHPREARVLSASDGRATVQFLSNGVRHEIPADWIVREEEEEPGSGAEVDRTKASRAALVLSLFTNEALGLPTVARPILSRRQAHNDQGITALQAA
eukprot:2978924-Alexandrium_andersonii.AAC.1